MSKWVTQENDTLIPTWLKSNISSKCVYCGNPIENFYNDDYRCTSRRCSNPNCISFAAAKAVFMTDVLEIPGFGFKTCLNMFRSVHHRNHVSLLRVIGYNKEMSLDTYLRIHCFPGVDSAWEQIVKKGNYYTLEELLAEYDGKFSNILQENKELLMDNLQYVKLKEKPVSHNYDGETVYITVMITGTPIGYNSKEHFIDELNRAMCGRIVLIHQKTAKQSDVDYLIREPGSQTKGKLTAAIKGGIPIVTSEEFIEKMTEIVLQQNMNK